MSDEKSYTQVPPGTLGALTANTAADIEVRLPTPSGGEPTLYRRSGDQLDIPDFQRMREHRIRHPYVRAADLSKCESLLESKLADLLGNAELTPAEKADIIHEVGASVARDLTRTAEENPDLKRVGTVVDSVIDCVFDDPMVASQLLHVAGHDGTIASHMFVVSTLAVLLGAEVFGFRPETLREFGFAGMLHDLGKVRIDPEILNKSEPLTPDEVQLIEQHPIESVRMVGHAPQVTPLVRQMILQHHERVDGKGYPVGASGVHLPVTSRIIAVVDSFHAMIGRCSYREPLTAPEANEALNKLAGKQFDPDILAYWNAVFKRCWLSTAGLTGVVAAFSDPAQVSSLHEHRMNPAPRTAVHQRVIRSRCSREVMVRCVYVRRLPSATPAPDEFFAPVHDVSRRGLCLYTVHPLYRGEVLHVQLRNAPSMPWVRAAVAWCRQCGDIHRAGLRFTQRISETEARDIQAVEDGPDTPPELRKGIGNKSQGVSMPSELTGADAGRFTVRDAWAALDAIAAMRHVPGEEERKAILFSTAPDAGIRRKSIDVLVRIGTQAACQALIALLGDSDANVRERAAAASGTARIHEASFPLRKLLMDPVESVSLRAAGALGRLGDRTGLPLVIAVLQSHGDNARLAAAVLGEIVGHRFPANAEGVQSAIRYLEAREPRQAKRGD